MGFFRQAKETLSATKTQVENAVIDKSLLDKKLELDRVKKELQEMQELLNDASFDIELGYKSTAFEFETVDGYKARLAHIRDQQKTLAKNVIEYAKNSGWTVNNSKSEGKKAMGNLAKLMLRGFNGECDEAVRKIKASNIALSKARIEKSAQAINKLGSPYRIAIPQEYVDLKNLELDIAYEFARFKECEKERIRELKAQEREAAQVEREIKEKRKALEKERKQYVSALDGLLKQVSEHGSTDDINQKIAELRSNLDEVDKGIEDVDYRAANQRAGYVYVISNIGSFGENVYKIGMTRRLEPMERIKELGDASVPFEFDVHALIFTEDAPALESALHREFDSCRVNMVNNRREFFKVTLDDIKRVVMDHYDKTVEFFDVPDAEQYRMTQALKKGE